MLFTPGKEKGQLGTTGIGFFIFKWQTKFFGILSNTRDIATLYFWLQTGSSEPVENQSFVMHWFQHSYLKQLKIILCTVLVKH